MKRRLPLKQARRHPNVCAIFAASATWSGLFGDVDSAAIALAVAAIQSERLLRQNVPSELESLSAPLPDEALRGCNVSSIVSASGINRETNRRKVNRLIQIGVLVREGTDIRFVPGFTQEEAVIEMMRTQLEEVRQAANHLLRDGVIKLID